MKSLGKPLRLVLGSLFGLLVVALVGIAGSSVYIISATADYRVSQPPNRPIALVFGAGVNPDGSLSPMLRDRVEAGVSLYKAGTVQKLLMSGDNGQQEYNEPEHMTEYAIAKGVPREDIVLDYAGFSTYDSCYRAKQIFGVSRAVLVTQAYHLPRAIYTCRKLGIDAVGMGLPDWQLYPDRKRPYLTREIGARVKALVQLNITHPEPKYLGAFEGTGG